jgi:hypothetical protein
MQLSFIRKVIAILVILTLGLSISNCSGGETESDTQSDPTGSSVEVKSALEIDPDNWEFRMLLGKYYVITKQYAKAVEDDGAGRNNWDDGFPYILRRNQTDMKAAIALADAYLKWGDSLNNVEETLDKYQEAELILENQAEYHNDNAKILFEQCRVDIRYRDYIRFNKRYASAKEKDPEFNKINEYTAGEIGEYLINAGRIETADEILKQMSRNESREPKVHYELAKLHYIKDQKGEAIDDLIRAKDYSNTYSLDPQKPGKLKYASYELLSKINNDIGKITLEITQEMEDRDKITENREIAKNHFINAIDYNKSNMEAFINLGDMYYSDLTQPNLTQKRNAAILNYVQAASIIISFELPENIQKILDKVVEKAIQENEIIIPPKSTSLINDSIEKILEQTSININIPATELFYKIGYLYYDSAKSYRNALENENLMNPTIRDLIYDVLGQELPEEELEPALQEPKVKKNLTDLIRLKIEEAEKIARNAFFIAYSKGVQIQRENPNLNFALGNSFYYEGLYKNATSHYKNMIGYLESYLENKYLSRDNNDPVKARIHLELAWAYNNLGATQYNMFRDTEDRSHFEKAQKSFLNGQTYYIKYEPNINNPKTGNLRDLFSQQNLNLTSNIQSTYQPEIYEDIYPGLFDIVD